MSPWLLAAPWLLVLLLIVWRNATAGPLLSAYAPVPTGRLLSVIIPARNEAVNIERCVRSVLSSTYAPLEVIVVNDRSSDATAQIVERLAASAAAAGRVRLVQGEELPAGWYGKSWAIMQGYRAAKGEVLLFTDADTTHTPELVPRAIAAMHAERADLVSVLPRQEMGTFWERLIQPQVFFALGARIGDLRRVNRTRTTWNAIANGQFILTARAVYEAIGTHAAVKDSIAEDMMLAQAYVAQRRDIFLLLAPEYMRTRMYRSLAEILAGWTKNLALGAPMMAPPIGILRRALPALMWLPVLAWIGPPIAWLAWRWEFTIIAMLASLLLWLEIYRRERAPLWYALLYPFGAAMVAFIMVRSAWRGGRHVEWRGRVYRAPGSG